MVARLYALQDSVTPEPSRFGLLNSKTLISGDDKEWRGGIALEPIVCNVDSRVVSICDDSNQVTATEPESDGVQEYVPFGIETKYTCSTFGFSENNYEAKARLALDLCQGRAAEREFWTGELAQGDPQVDSDGNPNPNRWLASTDAVDVTPTPGTAVKPRQGLALLEQALADCGCGAKGFIHATRGVASSFSEYLETEGDVLSTTLGNYVIAGSGYDGSGPDGSQPSGQQAWMYATGQVTARLGPISATPENFSEATNTRINEVSFTANRFAAVTWDGCCHYAVLVDLSLDYS